MVFRWVLCPPVRRRASRRAWESPRLSVDKDFCRGCLLCAYKVTKAVGDNHELQVDGTTSGNLEKGQVEVAGRERTWVVSSVKVSCSETCCEAVTMPGHALGPSLRP